RFHLPLVHRIDAESPEGHRHVACQEIGLAVLERIAVYHFLKAAGNITKIRTRIFEEEGVVADVVTPEVGAELKAVVPVRPGKVVNELILGDITSLRELILLTEICKRHLPREQQSSGEGTKRQRFILLEL